MGWEEWVPLITTVFSVIIAGISAWYVWVTKKLIALQLESQIRTRVDEAYKEVLNLPKEKEAEKLVDGVIENYFNAYDYACKKYLNKELNRENFRDMYTRELEKLCTDETYAEQIKKVDFRDIKKVYEKLKIGDK